jgi:hypothetical protein
MGCCQRNKVDKGAQLQQKRTVFIGNQYNGRRHKRNHVNTTKYTLLTFLPKSIALQFLKPANTVFLITAILQCISVISALSPITAVAPFLFVLSVSIAREGYEDYV